jgi:hypothetical protein
VTVYRIRLRSVTGREFEREFGSMTERVLFKLTLPNLRDLQPTVIEEYTAEGEK